MAILRTRLTRIRSVSATATTVSILTTPQSTDSTVFPSMSSAACHWSGTDEPAVLSGVKCPSPRELHSVKLDSSLASSISDQTTTSVVTQPSDISASMGQSTTDSLLSIDQATASTSSQVPAGLATEQASTTLTNQASTLTNQASTTLTDQASLLPTDQATFTSVDQTLSAPVNHAISTSTVIVYFSQSSTSSFSTSSSGSISATSDTAPSSSAFLLYESARR